MNTSICISQSTNCNSPQFTGKVDSSVNKYVKALKKEAKDIYVQNCKTDGIQMNPIAFRCIDERCDTALARLNQRAALLHKNTVIKAEKNPLCDDKGLYLCAENKRLLQFWEQMGAANTVMMNKNNLREASALGKNDYDMYITRFEGLVKQVNPENLDGKLVRFSIHNLWNLSVPKILKGHYAEKYTSSTQKVAYDIGYENRTFGDSLMEHFTTVREQMRPKKDGLSLWQQIKNFFN